MAGVSGVRGILGRGLDAAVAAAHASAFARMQGEGPIVVGRDPRAGGELLLEAVREGLTSAGRTVIDLGIVPTPTLIMNTALLEAAGGIMITASHNPVEWNGLKFADPAGRYLTPEASQTLFDLVTSGSTEEANAGPGAVVTDALSGRRHADRVVAATGVDMEAVSRADFTVVVDGVNGAGSWLIPEFLEEHGVTVHRLYCEPDGSFPRAAEPLPSALVDLGETVVETGADLGLGLDPDGDRLALVGPDGAAAGEESTLALAARRVLSMTSGPVVTNLSTSRMLDDVCEAAGVSLIRTPVGEINVVEGMLSCSAVIGGEGNGGVIHPEVVLGRDALTASALLLSAMAGDGVDYPTLRASIPSYAMRKERYAMPAGGVEQLRDHLPSAATSFPDAQIDERDGLRMEWKDRWVHVRPSNTEPIVRVISEAPSDEQAIDLARDVADVLGIRREQDGKGGNL
jgi:phosphomannomutase